MKKLIMALTLTGAAAAYVPVPVPACTGLTLKSADGAVVPARTVEWAGSRFPSQCVLVPRGYEQQSFTLNGLDGMKFKAKYGFAGLSASLPQFIVDGVNEKGFCVELFFFPGAGSYLPLDPAKLDRTIGDLQLVSLILGDCATIDEAKELVAKVRVAAIEPNGSASHWRMTQPDGKQEVLEIVDGVAKWYPCIGVLTNSPAYDWQLTNLANYINLYPGAAPTHTFCGIELKPISGGSGLLGLPGDFTSPSRFVRVAFFQNTARQQATAFMTVCQAFQILNNFDIPIGTAYAMDAKTPDMLTATQWTVATDLASKRLYYHTGVNGHIRCIDVGSIDFSKIKYTEQPVDKVTQQPVEMVTF